MLRTTCLENYDKWVTGELKFSSPEVKNAVETMVGDIWLNDKLRLRRHGRHRRPPLRRRAQGRCSTIRPSAGCTARATSSPPSSRQTPKPGVDYDVFYLPGIDPQYGKPVLVAGDIWAAFSDRPEVVARDGVLHQG